LPQPPPRAVRRRVDQGQPRHGRRVGDRSGAAGAGAGPPPAPGRVEVGNLAQLDEALAAGAEAILLDNLDDATLAEAVRRTRGRKPSVVLEASGNMTPERIARIRGFGLDLVSAGGLVHHAVWADLSLKLR
jgi:nicotinate-nucleotide pyrophosphorylase